MTTTTCLCISQTINGSQSFTINGYSLSKGIGIGNCIASETLTVGGYEWAMYVYPDGKDNSDYVSVFIALASDGTDVRALFELSLLDQSGKGKHKVYSHFDRLRHLSNLPSTLKRRGSMWGYRRFLRTSVLEKSDFLKDDCLKFTWTVGVVCDDLVGKRVEKLSHTVSHQTKLITSCL